MRLIENSLTFNRFNTEITNEKFFPSDTGIFQVFGI